MHSKCCGSDSSFWHLSPNLYRPCSSQFPLLFISVPPSMSYFFFSSSSSLSFQRASLASDLSFTARASCLTLPLSPPVCVLNHNPANPTSNGVYWERYQTWPLGLALWPSYSHEKQGFNTICLTAFSEPAMENHQIFKYTQLENGPYRHNNYSSE